MENRQNAIVTVIRKRGFISPFLKFSNLQTVKNHLKDIKELHSGQQWLIFFCCFGLKLAH